MNRSPAPSRTGPAGQGPDPEQEKRTAKALKALNEHTLDVALLAPDTWRVKNGDGEPHVVGRAANRWACDCPDFGIFCQRRSMRCYHIEAVRLTPPRAGLTAPNQSIQHKETQMSDTNHPMTGWVKLYHPSGAQVTLPVPADGSVIAPETAKAAFDSITALLGAAWLVTAPGLEDGEKIEEIKHVVKRVKINDDGSETPIVDLYPDRANFRILGVYLNTAADVQAFESVSGVKIADLLLYEGDNAIERGKGPKTDKYVTALPRPVKVVFKANPRWEGEEDKKHPKRIFVRWGDAPMSADGEAKPAKPNGNRHTAASTAQPTDELTKAREFVMPEGKSTKGKKLGGLDDATLKLIASEQYQPTTAVGNQAKVYAALLLKHASTPI